MKIDIGCYNELGSVTMKDRYQETVYTYDVRYSTFPFETAIPGENRTLDVPCAVCGEILHLRLNDRRTIALRQSVIPALFLLMLPLSLFLFDRAVNDATNGMWIFAILHFVFFVAGVGYLAFDIRQYEFEHFIAIKNRNNSVRLDERMRVPKHRLMDEGYPVLYGRQYAYYRALYFAVIAAYVYGLYTVIAAAKRSIADVLIAFGLILAGLPLYLLVSFLYDRFAGREVRIR